ncbi:MAG: GtrA family protein [bacterium]
MAKPKLLLVIPIYNEEEQIESSMRKLFDYATTNLLDYEWKVLVGDNASKDKSAEIYQRLTKENPERFGYSRVDKKGRGLNLKNVWLNQDFDYSIYMDCDLSTDVKHIKKMIDVLRNGQADLAIGSRLAKGAKVVGRKKLRELTSRVYVLIIKIIASTRITDYQCGFKSITKKWAMKVLPHVEDNTWYFDTELILLTEKSGHKIYEEPVFWTDDPGTTVKIWKTAMDDLKGLYRTLKQKKWLDLANTSVDKKKYASTLFDFIMQFAKFFIIGGLSFILNWSLMVGFQLLFNRIVLFSIGTIEVKTYLAGSIFAYILSAIFNYFANRKFTFGHTTKKIAKQISVFFIVSCVGLLLNSILVYLFVEKVGISSFWVTPLAAAIVLFWNFFGQRTFAFKKSK